MGSAHLLPMFCSDWTLVHKSTGAAVRHLALLQRWTQENLWGK